MPTQTHVMVARDRRARMHSIVRATMPWELDRPVPAATADQLNTLMMAKTPLSLVEAAELVGPLRRRGDGLEGRLFLTAAQLGGLVADGTLGEPDARQLVDECVLDPLWRLADGGTFEREGRNPIGDARKVAATRGPGRMADLFGPTDGEDGRFFVIEPLQDWVLLRNLLSIAMRFGGMTRRMSHETDDSLLGLLERAGFAEVHRTSFSSWLALDKGASWILPLSYNPWFRDGSILANDLDYPSELMHPLVDRLFELRRGKAGLGTYRALKGSEADIRLLTASSASATDSSATPRNDAPDEARLLYLALHGDDQRTLADGYLHTLDALLGTDALSYAGYEIGAIPVDHCDAAGALWATFLRHEGRYLMTCRQCGRTVLSTTQGGAREFCSDTCRATHNKATREQGR